MLGRGTKLWVMSCPFTQKSSFLGSRKKEYGIKKVKEGSFLLKSTLMNYSVNALSTRPDTCERGSDVGGQLSTLVWAERGK